MCQRPCDPVMGDQIPHRPIFGGKLHSRWLLMWLLWQQLVLLHGARRTTKRRRHRAGDRTEHDDLDCPDCVVETLSLRHCQTVIGGDLRRC